MDLEMESLDDRALRTKDHHSNTSAPLSHPPNSATTNGVDSNASTSTSIDSSIPPNVSTLPLDPSSSAPFSHLSASTTSPEPRESPNRLSEKARGKRPITDSSSLPPSTTILTHNPPNRPIYLKTRPSTVEYNSSSSLSTTNSKLKRKRSPLEDVPSTRNSPHLTSNFIGASGGDGDADFYVASGRSLRARGTRPSYLEIPPASIRSSASPPPVEVVAEHRIKKVRPDKGNESVRKEKGKYDSGNGRNSGGGGGGGGTAYELLKVSGKVVKRFKRWARDRRSVSRGNGGGGNNNNEGGVSSESELSDLSSDGDDGDGPIRLTKSEEEALRVKRGRGRPRGSFKVPQKPKVVGRGRGRPKGSLGKPKEAREVGGGNHSDSTLSSLSDSDREGNKISKKKKKQRTVRNEESGESSSLSSLESSPEPLPRILPFPHKPTSHPLNRLNLRPRPSSPPRLSSLYRVDDFNPFNWAEGIRHVTLSGEVVEPTYLEEIIVTSTNGTDRPTKAGKKRPGWDWAIDVSTARSESPDLFQRGSSIAHPPQVPSAGASPILLPTTDSRSGSVQPPSLLSLAGDSGLRRTGRIPLLAPPSTILPVASSLLSRPPPQHSSFLSVPTSSNMLLPPTTRPKTYRQIARIDWEGFHQRNRCRFTTSGAIEGVNPEGLVWEDWFGVEDDGVEKLKRTFSALDARDNGDLIVFDRKAMVELSGVGKRKELDWVEEDATFANGMEWKSEWRFKTLEEGMGRAFEGKCRWAVRNPAREYVEESSSDSEEEEEDAETMVKKAQMAARRREKRKEKQNAQLARRTREGSAGDSDLTPLEDEDDEDSSTSDLSSASESDDAATIAKRSTLLMEEAAESHAATGKMGVMVRCPMPTCPQRFYRQKASSSIVTHNRHYHTPSIFLKYASGKYAWIGRNEEGNFVCPKEGCDFATKSRGTMAVHGKPGKCDGPNQSIPKPGSKNKSKRTPLVFPSTAPASALEANVAATNGVEVSEEEEVDELASSNDEMDDHEE